MAITGHVTIEQTENGDATAGVEFDDERNAGILYIDEGSGSTEIPLTLEDLGHLKEQIGVAINAMRWHNASWLDVSFGNKLAASHLAAKHAETTLCGRQITESAYCYPLLKEPSREKRSISCGGTCQRCLAAYDKQQQKKVKDV